MSCDHLAAHAIATLGASLSPEARSQLQAVYDLPAALQPGEDGPALRRAARGLVLRLKAAGATIPAHLDPDNPRSRAAIRFGRLALALAGNWGGSPVAAQAAPAQPGDREAVALMRNLAVSAARLAFRERLAAGERVPVAEALAYLQQQRQRQPALVSSMWAAVAEEVEPGERDAFTADWEAALGPVNPVQEGEAPPPPPITATPDIKVTSERLNLDLAVPDGPKGAAHAGLSYHGRRGYRFDALRQRGIREAVVVESLLVYEGFRGRGYGERLLQEAIRRAHAEGLPLALKATPLPDGSSYNRAELIAWYQKRGGQLLTEGGQWMVWPVPSVTVSDQAPQKADPAHNDEYGYHDPDKYCAAATAWAEHHLTLMERGGEQGEQAYQTVVRELEANSSALYAISSDRVTSLAYELQKRSRSGSRPAFYNDLVDRVTTHWTSDWSDRSESQKRDAWDAWAAGGEVRYDSPELTDSRRRDIIELAISESFE